RDSDYSARIGGDEFALLLVGCPMDKARQIAESIVRAIADYRFVWQNRIFTLGVSIGLVEIGSSSGTAEQTLAAADSACYVAKQRGRGRVEVYTAREETIARERGEIQWLKRIQQALDDGSFELQSQTILAVGSRSGGPAIEMLLRLPAADGDIAAPDEFLVAAERYQLMPEIDRWVVKTTLAAVSTHKIRLPEGRGVSINLSGQTLGDESFLEFVVDCLDRSGVAPSSICFEVTESALIANLSNAQRFIEVLHGMGAEFALDDFGSGLSSFAYLKNLQVDYLKIDGFFVRDILDDSINFEMVKSINDLGHVMGKRTVAECVESNDVLDALRSIGVDYAQGYALSPPTTWYVPS
ncbi:MAG: EAL domain-containing protein, partial [Pseudomonadota bacterium]